MQVKGRYLVVAWTAVFLAAVGAIVFRTSAGFRMQERVTALNDSIRAADAMYGDLAAKVATLQSRPVLAPKVEALGLRFASDSELRLVSIRARP
jgi:cell division protein FtsL